MIKKKIKEFETVKAIITDKGDSYVGIFSYTHSVECPFSKEYIDTDTEGLEFFRKALIDLYWEYADSTINVRFDFEK